MILVGMDSSGEQYTDLRSWIGMLGKLSVNQVGELHLCGNTNHTLCWWR